jgi:hypothetical protein
MYRNKELFNTVDIIFKIPYKNYGEKPHQFDKGIL